MRKWTEGMMAALVVGSFCLGSLPVLGQTTNSPGIDAREANQQRRITQGVESGQITPREFNRLERQQGRIQAAEARMKADGNLTPKERAKLQKRLDHSSRKIYRAKHNNRAVPPVN
jgi:hypothetical protein